MEGEDPRALRLAAELLRHQDRLVDGLNLFEAWEEDEDRVGTAAAASRDVLLLVRLRWLAGVSRRLPLGEHVPMGRPAQPDEIAPSYVFFAAGRLSSYYSGEVLAPLGGETLPG